MAGHRPWCFILYLQHAQVRGAGAGKPAVWPGLLRPHPIPYLAGYRAATLQVGANMGEEGQRVHVIAENA